MPKEEPQLLSLKEACVVLSIPYTSVLYHYRAGRIPVTRISGRNLITPEALRQVMDTLGYRRKTPRAA